MSFFALLVVVVHSMAAGFFVHTKNWHALAWVVSASIWAADVAILKGGL